MDLTLGATSRNRQLSLSIAVAANTPRFARLVWCDRRPIWLSSACACLPVHLNPDCSGRQQVRFVSYLPYLRRLRRLHRLFLTSESEVADCS